MKGLIKTACAVCFGGWCGVGLALDLAALSIDGDLTGVWDNNQSQAQYERDQVEDKSMTLGVNLGYPLTLSRQSLLKVSWFAEYENWESISTLNRQTLGGKGALRWQPSSAFTAPLIEFNLSWQDDNYRENTRDSGVLNSQLFVTRRMTDRITSTAGLHYRKRDSEGSVWDLEDARIFFNADYTINQWAAAYLTYSYIEGDVSSSAQRRFCNGVDATHILPIINAATAIENDNAYNDELCGEWLAYRLEGKTQAWVVGLNYALSHSLAFDFSVLTVDVTELDDDDVYYDRRIMRASMLKRF